MFHARPYYRFIEIKYNLRRKELYGRNQDLNSLGDNLEENNNSNILITEFSSRTDPIRISEVNMTEPAFSGGFGHIHWKNP